MSIRESIKSLPQTELSKRLYGIDKKYPHMSICSGDRRKPIGEPGCICLSYLKRRSVDLGNFI